MSANDGGPAFPVTNYSDCQYPGMTLLDWFATHATEADIKALDEETGYRLSRPQLRFKFAGYMLAERGDA